jgi:hypothetical protein
VVEALAEHVGVFKKLDDRNQVDSKISHSTAVTAVFQRAVVVNSRAVESRKKSPMERARAAALVPQITPRLPFMLVCDGPMA